MEKMITINLGGTVTRIKPIAWQMHLAYIETLHCYFRNEEGCFEIINDIESRMGELMQEFMHKKGRCIEESDIEEIIKIMGTADEFRALDANDCDISISSTEHYKTNDSVTTISYFKEFKMSGN